MDSRYRAVDIVTISHHRVIIASSLVLPDGLQHLHGMHTSDSHRFRRHTGDTLFCVVTVGA